jgi:iron complex transport system ATP-binding protein
MSDTRNERSVALRVNDLVVTFGARAVVRRLELTCRQGEFVALIGANGAGKSTVLRAIVGYVPCTGLIECGGLTVVGASAQARARRVAYLPQQIDLPHGLTVGEFIALGRHPWREPFTRWSVADEAAVVTAIEGTGVEGLVGRSLETLSGGERQRVYVAAALAQDAPVLLLDEPTNALDPVQRDEVWSLLDRLRRERHLTILTATHDIEAVARYADQFIAVRDGAIVASGAPATFLTTEMRYRTYGRGLTAAAFEVPTAVAEGDP